jgi:hypothetical protein
MDLTGKCQVDQGRQNPPPRPCRGGVHSLQLVRHVRVGPSVLLLLPSGPGGVQPPTTSSHPPLHPPRGSLRPFHGDVHGGAPLPLHPPRSRREVGAYYFQLRHGMASSYISAFSSSKWEDWREGWVIAEADPHDRLELPTEGPQSDRSTWKAKPTIPAELDPVLNRIKKLARSGLTSMMVLGDFLKRRIAPLQQRSRMAYMYTGLNDC